MFLIVLSVKSVADMRMIYFLLSTFTRNLNLFLNNHVNYQIIQTTNSQEGDTYVHKSIFMIFPTNVNTYHAYVYLNIVIPKLCFNPNSSYMGTTLQIAYDSHDMLENIVFFLQLKYYVQN